MSIVRKFGRRYVIRWDDEVRRYHVMLGKDSIGFHATQDGAKQLAAAHAGQVTMLQARQSFDVQIQISD